MAESAVVPAMGAEVDESVHINLVAKVTSPDGSGNAVQ